jgi:peptidoglycan/LPS O-acetylase OafA/YrhL
MTKQSNTRRLEFFGITSPEPISQISQLVHYDNSMKDSVKSRLIYLDLLRFFAAMFVLSLHFSFAAQHYEFGSVKILNYDWPVGNIARYGLLGVDIFFVISGAVITMSALSRKPSDFVIARFARLFPSFILLIPIAILVTRYLSAQDNRLYVGKAGLSDLWFSLSLSNWIYQMPVAAEGATWTLWVEVRFYFLIFLLLICMNLMKQDLNSRHLLYFGYLWFISCQISIYSQNSLLQSFLVSEYSNYFLIGLSLAILRKNIDLQFSTYPLLFFSGINSFYTLKIRLNGLNLFVGFSIFIVFACLIYISLNLTAKESKFSNFCILLGGVSYPLYLSHDRIGGVLVAFFDTYFSSHYLSMFFATLILLTSLVFWVKFGELKFRKYIYLKLKKEIA